MYNSNGLTMELVTENGNKITEFGKDGLTFVEGRKGSEYKIKVTNHTYSKIKVVISVDGLDIMTGQRAKPNAGGYVLNGYETQIIDGWRISENEVRKFFFTNQKNSYNSKTGNDTNNLGVIGILAYKAYVQPATSFYHTLDSGKYYFTNTSQPVLDSFPMNGTICTNMIMGSVAKESYSNLSKEVCATNRAEASVGTGMGKVETSKIKKVYDVFESIPYASIMLYYKSRKELENMGIKVVSVKTKPLPSAFEGYCKQV